VGVGGVVVDNGRVLLVRRAHPPLQGEWSLPGGAVEPGETLTAATVREVFEETGLAVSVHSLVDVVDRIHWADDGRLEYHYVVADYLCTPNGTTISAGSDAMDARWVGVDELKAYGIGDPALGVIHKALAVLAAKTVR
jgi:ADP-ribose pyrophosphatase YjhB (NUDIX family)